MTTTKQYDFLNRLQSISSAAFGTGAPSLPVGFAYQYNDANQRTRMALGDGSYWVYTYDKLGQVISGNKYWQDGSPVDGQQFNYAFDDIGNRDKTGGRASAASDYTANRLNQYTSRTNAPAVDVLGIANPTAGVTVNGNVANRKGDYFHWPLTVANSSAQYPTITVVSQYGATQTDAGEVFVPAATESYTYDTDGNLTADGRWNYTWDAENRLIELKRDASSPTLTSHLRLTFEYDHQSRRIRKTYYTHNGSTWVEQTDTVFLYDGWNLMGDLDANASNNKLRTYIWGTDLSGSDQGAGGVGGLLKVSDYTSGKTQHFVAYDGNGNVAALIDGSTGAATARYEYGPFGEAIRTTGTMAKKNPFRFSTKYTDEESGFLYYGYRYFNPSSGRWPSRDPIGEPGFEGNKYFNFTKEDLQSLDALDPEDENIDALEAAQNNILFAAGKTAYVMVNNDPVGKTDLYGLVCNTVANRTKAPMSSGLINAGHEWIVYDGKSVGFWPNRGYVVLRPDPGQTTPFPIYWQWETEQKKSGTIKWGAAAGKSCACAACAAILASIDAAPNPGWQSFAIRNNCRRFVKWVFDGSCLKKGKKTSLTP